MDSASGPPRPIHTRFSFPWLSDWRAFAVPVIALCLVVAPVSAWGQTAPSGFVSGEAEAAWTHWQAALRHLLARETEASETAFGELAALNPSPLRLALLEERTRSRTREAGALLMLEEDAASDALGANAKKIFNLLLVGREQMNQADDGWYFASIGRFDVAAANLQALLASDPDPVAMVEFVDRARKRHEILVQLSDHPVLGETARGLIALLQEGERRIKADPVRIKEHIARLSGPPRAFDTAVANLVEAGEFAVPFLIEAMRDPQRKDLLQPILRVFPMLDRGALNPLVQALRMGDETTKGYLIGVLGQIPYPQSIPYLLRVAADPKSSPQIQEAARSAIQSLQSRSVSIATSSAPEAFYSLADAYYEKHQSLMPDPRLDTANVWYWQEDGGVLENIEVPTPIFEEIMAMRCAEEALVLQPEFAAAQGLWLAANFRRAAGLADGQTDRTRPDGFPSPAFFAEAAGPQYCLIALARAIHEKEPAVALGCISALRRTAGPSSMTADAAGRNPLAEALSFPHRLVRIQAGLALAWSLPTAAFPSDQNLMPALVEALAAHKGLRTALVVDSDEANANAVAGVLREEGYEVIVDAGLASGLEKARNSLGATEVIFLASDTQPTLDEAIAALRQDFRLAATPVVVIAKEAQRAVVRAMVNAGQQLGMTPTPISPEAVRSVLQRVASGSGAGPLSAVDSVAIAMDAAGALRALALSRNDRFAPQAAEAALIEALSTPHAELRAAVADALAFVPSTAAQEALASIALQESESFEVRRMAFTALADAAKRTGNHLTAETVEKLVAICSGEPSDVREAASRALGALNLPGNPASTLIRNQHRG